MKSVTVVNTELIATLGGAAGHIILGKPYNKSAVEASFETMKKIFGVLDQHLLHNTFLASERITLPDIALAGFIFRASQYVGVLIFSCF